MIKAQLPRVFCEVLRTQPRSFSSWTSSPKQSPRRRAGWPRAKCGAWGKSGAVAIRRAQATAKRRKVRQMPYATSVCSFCTLCVKFPTVTRQQFG